MCWLSPSFPLPGHSLSLNLLLFSEQLVVCVYCRTKPLLFYFNIMKCASPMVLLEFQCPTTQVTWTFVFSWYVLERHVIYACLCTCIILAHALHLFCHQMCVEKCPDKFLTLLKAYTNKEDFKYYKNFCKEGLEGLVSSMWRGFWDGWRSSFPKSTWMTMSIKCQECDSVFL